MRPVDTPRMRLRTPTLDLLASEFAQAVARGDNDQAEGWLAVAQAVAVRQRDRRPRAWRLWTTAGARTSVSSA